MIDTRAGKAGHGARRGDSREYVALLAITYPFFLAAVLVDRLLPASRRFFAGEKAGRAGIFGEAWSAARTTLPFAFMG
jgi:hypothetical protein